MPRFVILTHDYPSLHWDFMLEKQAELRTWRLSQPPDVIAEISAEALPGHRIAYLDYEGPVSGNRGHVVRWDRGEYVSIAETEEFVEIDLRGDRLTGRAILRKSADGLRWVFYFTASSSTASA